MKYNSRLTRCQQKFKDSIISLDIQQSPVEYFRENLTRTETLVFKQICHFKQRYNIFRTSQSWIAQKLGVSREYVCRIMSKFEALGIIKMWYHHKATSHYRLSSFFTNEIIASLSHLWRALPLTLLMSYTAPDATSEKSSQNINDLYLLLTTKYNVLSNSRSKEDDRITQRQDNSLSNIVRSKEGQDTPTKQNDKVISQQPDTTKQCDRVLSSKIKLSQKRKEMNEVETLRQLDFDYLKSIKPTLSGKVKLTAYPTDIVQEVDTQLLNMRKSVGNRWAYFNKTCSILCEQRGIEPSWSTMYSISTQLGIQVIAPFIDESFVTPVSASREIPSKGKMGAGAARSSVSHSVSFADAIKNNRALTERYNTALSKTLPPVEENIAQRLNFEALPEVDQQTARAARIATVIKAELEQLKKDDPDRFARRDLFAKALLVKCGRDPMTGEPLGTMTPQESLDVLKTMFNG